MEIVQDILIIVLAGLMMVDENGPVIISWFPVIVGMIVGIIMGDMQTALAVAGTFQLMMLGVAALGGASAPNYGLATIIGGFVAIRTGTGINSAVAIGIPVGLLAIQLEVVARIICNFLAHYMVRLVREKKFMKMRKIAILGPTLFFLQTALPTVIVVVAGPIVVKQLLKIIPAWVTDGLTVAGGMLPVVGIALLMHYMPVKKFLPFIIASFVLAAYVKVPLLGIALIGFAASYWYFFQETKKGSTPAVVGVTNQNEENDDYDE
ncbi:PTS sugar transporter subunit IIC [Sporolactobacillus shoreicorticis]|uniref:PTS mannose/fructose/sorbose/N-acetylgalactosamine transporter subunit IIC n=1 Tax=Sporolactobacillus shoreicorticis TaxID=1923877 RepID=A0ABW5S0V4_9BACL|nr:PTS sugar transporter subunit IIC [Sporolactobacillus shoreicorticis]MCO7124693.1 PTS sugar transporter subunit IIC [Sporolactobacillus shoreicorticis]